MRVASMPMYDMPEVRPALDALWAGLARHLAGAGIAEVPEALVYDRALADLWHDPDLLFSQCCGSDLIDRYAGKLQPLAVPHYDVPGCEGAEYSSAIVVAEDAAATDVAQLRGAVCAINGPGSHSGMGALRALIAPLSRGGRFFSEVKVSGGHAASLEMVGRGEADVAAIDCVTYALLARYRPASIAGTRILGWTQRAPALPFVTSKRTDTDALDRLRAAMSRAFADPDLAAARRALFLEDIEALPLAAFDRIAEMWDLAVRHGYPELR